MESEAVSRALVTLQRGNEVHRRLTDEKGRFRFSGLRPGDWTLRVQEVSLPENFEIETKELPVVLGPGEEIEVVLRAVSVLRTIRMLELQGGEAYEG